MKFGYARVSTREQSLNLQKDALSQEGCTQIIEEQVSGVKADRPKLEKLLSELREGDTLVVWRLDRLGRSLKNLVELTTYLNEKKIGLKSLNDPIDTTTSQGRFVFNLFASLAEFERDIIKERTLAGLEAARQRGRTGGRPKGLSKEGKNKALAAETLYREQKLSTRQISKQLGISTSTLYAYLKSRGVHTTPYKRKLAA
jgi:DNA invertase Pin-like site-specific DNA recombinase